MDSHNIKKL